MKTYQEHLLAERFLTANGNGGATDGRLDEDSAQHPLALELRRIMNARNSTDIGSFARLVERLAKEMALVQEQLAPGGLHIGIEAGPVDEFQK